MATTDAQSGGGRATRLLIAAFAAVMMLPFAYGAMVSLMDAREVLSDTPQFWPPKLGNYVTAWTAVPFPRYFLNSAIVTLAVTAGSTLTAILAAYVFARMSFVGKRALFMAVIATLMIPGHITLIPNYLTFAELRLLDSYWALILPFLASGFSVFFLRQYFLGIPREIDEAARLDGAGHWKILWQMIVPMSWPAIAAVALFTALAEWNSFIWPLIATTSEEMRTVQIGLRYLYRSEAESGSIDWPLVMAGSLIVLVPMIAAYWLVERRLTHGIAFGTTK